MSNLYKPHPTEPSIFGPIVGGVTLDWLCWFLHNRDKAIKCVNYPVSMSAITTFHANGVEVNPMTVVRKIRWLIKLTKTTDLSDTPPMMFLEGRSSKTISLLWVIDTCVRDDMTPEEATLLAMGFMKD